MTEDIESGVDEVRYIWTREVYNIDSSSFKKVALPGPDGKYIIETTKQDTPYEGIYYLNVLAVNGSGKVSVKGKAFISIMKAPYHQWRD